MRAFSSPDPPVASTRLSEAERTALLAIARTAIAARLGREPAPPRAPTGLARLDAPAAVFVTLKLAGAGPTERGHLRGCIGTLEASEPLWRAVAENAERAAFDDPRFPPLGDDELERIVIHLSVIRPRRRIGGAEEIRLGRDGVVLERGSRRGVFLPQVALEQGWDVGRLLEQLACKAGLGPDDWRSSELYAFESETFGESRAGESP